MERQDVYVIIASFLIGGSIVYAGYYASFGAPLPDLTNPQALVIEAAFAVFLTLIFYSLQRRNERFFERRDERRKQFWLDLASRNVNSIRAWHVRLLERYDKSLKENLKEEDPILKTDLTMAAKRITEAHTPRIATAITQIADLLDDPGLFNQLTLYEFNTFVKPDRYSFGKQHYEDQVKGLTGAIDYINKILERMKRESPNRALDTTEAL